MTAARSTPRDSGRFALPFLALAFAAFVAIGIVTVILPELENAEEADGTTPVPVEADASGEPATAP